MKELLEINGIDNSCKLFLHGITAPESHMDHCLIAV